MLLNGESLWKVVADWIPIFPRNLTFHESNRETPGGLNLSQSISWSIYTDVHSDAVLLFSQETRRKQRTLSLPWNLRMLFDWLCDIELLGRTLHWITTYRTQIMRIFLELEFIVIAFMMFFFTHTIYRIEWNQSQCQECEHSVPVDVMWTGTVCSSEKAKESFRYDPSRFWSQRSDGRNKKQVLLWILQLLVILNRASALLENDGLS